MKWVWIHPEPDRWEWEASDELLRFASTHQMPVRNHTVVWPHWSISPYTTECHDAGALRRRLVDHVQPYSPDGQRRWPEWMWSTSRCIGWRATPPTRSGALSGAMTN